MLIYVNGDLLESDCTVIFHQANCFKTMGAGIARSIAKKYKEAKFADDNFPLSAEERLGEYSYALTDGPAVVNLYGQYHYGRGKQTNYPMLRKALCGAITDALLNETPIDTYKLGVPYKVGCGLAGGSWDVVEKMLHDVSEELKVDIHIYKLEGEK